MANDQFAAIYDDLMELLQKAENAATPAERDRHLLEARAAHKDMLAHKEHFSEAQLKRVSRRLQHLATAK